MNNDLSRRLEVIEDEIKKRDEAIEWVKHVVEEDPSKEEASKEEIERLTREKEELEKAKEELEETKEEIKDDYSSSDIVIEGYKSTNMWRNFFDNLKSRTSSIFDLANSNIDRDAREFANSVNRLNEDLNETNTITEEVIEPTPVEEPTVSELSERDKIIDEWNKAQGSQVQINDFYKKYGGDLQTALNNFDHVSTKTPEPQTEPVKKGTLRKKVVSSRPFKFIDDWKDFRHSPIIFDKEGNIRPGLQNIPLNKLQEYDQKCKGLVLTAASLPLLPGVMKVVTAGWIKTFAALWKLPVDQLKSPLHSMNEWINSVNGGNLQFIPSYGEWINESGNVVNKITNAKDVIQAITAVGLTGAANIGLVKGLREVKNKFSSIFKDKKKEEELNTEKKDTLLLSDGEKKALINSLPILEMKLKITTDKGKELNQELEMMKNQTQETDTQAIQNLENRIDFIEKERNEVLKTFREIESLKNGKRIKNINSTLVNTIQIRDELEEAFYHKNNDEQRKLYGQLEQMQRNLDDPYPEYLVSREDFDKKKIKYENLEKQVKDFESDKLILNNMVRSNEEGGKTL